MRYEIITDSRDMLVLVVNSRVIEVSRNMSKILDIIEADHKERMIKAEDKPINPITTHEKKKEDTKKDNPLETLLSLGDLLNYDDKSS